MSASELWCSGSATRNEDVRFSENGWMEVWCLWKWITRLTSVPAVRLWFPLSEHYDLPRYNRLLTARPASYLRSVLNEMTRRAICEMMSLMPFLCLYLLGCSSPPSLLASSKIRGCPRRRGRHAWRMRKSKRKTVNETATFRSCVPLAPEIYDWLLASLHPSAVTRPSHLSGIHACEPAHPYSWHGNREPTQKKLMCLQMWPMTF